MKITSLHTYMVPPRWCFLKLETDEGVTGWGEPVIEGKAHTVEAAVKEMEDFLIGKDPLAIQDLWNTLYRGGFYRGGPILMSAIAGIDQALWDIKGKWLNVPVYDLLGGRCRDKMRIYAWIGGDRPSEVAEEVIKQRDAGFTAVKMNASEEMQIIDSHKKIDSVIERIAAIRDAVGLDVEVGIDFHGRVHKPMAKMLAKELEPFKPMFIEEPVLPEHNDALGEIARHTSIPIATGERMYSRWDFKTLLSEGHVDIIQPDLSHAGGITECVKIASMAEAYDVAVAPHCPLGPIALASCLQVDAVSYNAYIQEQSLGIHYNVGNDIHDYILNPEVFHYEDGHVSFPSKPGLGVEMDEERVKEKAAEGHRWRNPIWRHKDGSIAEW